MDLDQESKPDIGIGINLRYVLAIRIELQRMPATVFAEQSRVERSPDVINAGVRLLPYRPADQIAEPGKPFLSRRPYELHPRVAFETAPHPKRTSRT